MSSMIQLSLNISESQIAAFRARGLERALFRALTKGGRDAIRTLKSASSRSIRQRKRIKVRALRWGLLTKKHAARTIPDLQWEMKVDTDAQPVSAYSFRQMRKGVRVAINTGVRHLIPGAFVARMKSGHEGVFQRDGKARLPIDELFTSRISDVFDDRGMVPALTERTMSVFAATTLRVLPMELDRELSRFLKRGS